MRIAIISLALLCTSFTWAQDDVDMEIIESACVCIEDVDTSLIRAERYQEVKSCISSSILQFQMKQTLIESLEKVKDTLDSKESIDLIDSLNMRDDKNIIVVDKDYEIIEERLLRDCRAMQRVMMNDSEEAVNSISENTNAIDFYNSGQEYYRNEQ